MCPGSKGAIQADAPAAQGAVPSKGFSYDKWNDLEVSDDEGEQRLNEYKKTENSQATSYARGLIGRQAVLKVLTDAFKAADEDSTLNNETTEAVLSFVCVQQHSGGSADNRPEAANIIPYFEERRVPQVERLVLVTLYVRERLDADKDTLQPVSDLLVGALNTIAAAQHVGSARRLFERLDALTLELLSH